MSKETKGWGKDMDSGKPGTESRTGCRVNRSTKSRGEMKRGRWWKQENDTRCMQYIGRKYLCSGSRVQENSRILHRQRLIPDRIAQEQMVWKTTPVWFMLINQPNSPVCFRSRFLLLAAWIFQSWRAFWSKKTCLRQLALHETVLLFSDSGAGSELTFWP